MSVILQFSQSSSPQIPFTMNKSLTKSSRQFGRNLKNNLTESDLQSKLALKTRSRKNIEIFTEDPQSSRPQMEYFDDVLKYVFTTLSYPNPLKGPEKVKRDVQMLLNQVTATNGLDFIWQQNFIIQNKSKNAFFLCEDITLEKRASLLDWIIAVHKKYKLRQQTLHLTVRLIDDYCIKNFISLKRYQLLGTAALFMAAKYVEIQLPRFKDYHRLIEAHFSTEQMIEIQSQILIKSQFQLSKKITTLWYLQAFGMSDLIFKKSFKYTKKSRKQQQENKQNLRLILPKEQEQQEDRFQNFMTTCKYMLNLIMLDYKITIKYKQDIIAISTLIFVCFKRQFADSDSKGLLKYFVQKKSKLIEQSQTSDQISRAIKKCVKKIQKLNSQRFDNRFYTINQKFNIDIKN